MMALNYKNKQIITLYSFLNQNYAKLEGATNVPVDGKPQQEGDDWKWLFRLDIPIKNFSIQSAFFHEDKLIVFAKGTPIEFNETYSSFFIVFDLIVHDGLISILNPHYNLI